MKALLPAFSLALFACGSGNGGISVEGADYVLTLEPVVPRNQPDLFDEFDALGVQLQHGDGTVEHYMLSSLQSGGEELLEALSDLDQTTVVLLGMDNVGATLGVGRTEPISITTGEQSQKILVSRVDSMAELAPLSEDHMGASLVSVGDGVFLLFGGSEEYADTSGSINPTPSGFSDVLELRLGTPDEALEFQNIGQMPRRDGESGSCDDNACDRVSFSATLLTGLHDDKGKILVMGGAYDFMGSSIVTDTGFLWDPETHSAEVLDGSSQQLLQPSFFHTSTEDPQGNVIIAGGSSSAVEDFYFSPHGKVDVYDPFSRKLDQASGTPAGQMIWHAAARLADVGVLICGGTTFTSSSSYGLSTTCDLVDVSGAFVGLDEGDMLPIGLVHHQMTTLADGRVLVTGGFSSETNSLPVNGSGGVDATGSDRAFIYDGDTWTETGSMNIGRGGHGAALLPDGQVIIVGGEDTTDSLFPDGYDAIACAEVFDPETLSFAALSSCDSSSSAGDLSMPAAFPAIAADPVFGALVVGGMMDQSGTDEVMVYSAAPLED